MEKQTIKFDKWYKKPLPHYFARGPMDKGTNVFVRGTQGELLDFIEKLHKEYFPNEDSMRRYALGITEVALGKVLDGMRGDEYFACFSDDRIRGVERLDSEWCKKGPLSGSKNHLEIRFNEQYGGDYPANPLLSSRAGMIEHVLNAFEKLAEEKGFYLLRAKLR